MVKVVAQASQNQHAVSLTVQKTIIPETNIENWQCVILQLLLRIMPHLK
jgi:hypothetical protein